MQFLVDGNVTSEAVAALKKEGHTTHTLEEISDLPHGNATELLAALVKKQWHLVTTDNAMVHEIFEHKLIFPAGLIVFLQTAESGDYAAGIGRLFERYKRLIPKRLYTITASRVKIRQLPGEM